MLELKHSLVAREYDKEKLEAAKTKARDISKNNQLNPFFLKLPLSYPGERKLHESVHR